MTLIKIQPFFASWESEINNLLLMNVMKLAQTNAIFTK